MTRESGDRRPGVPLLWFLPFGVLAGAAAAVLAGVISRSIILDFIAWWPVWVGLAVPATLSRRRYWGPIRVAGLVPLLAFPITIAFLIGHVQGWPLMPSAGGRLIGPEATGFGQASLSAAIDGTISLSAGAEYLYEASPERWGGEVGVPEGFEETTDNSIFITLRPASDPALQTFSGWEVRLAEGPSWDLNLSGSVTADLTGLDMTGLEVAGHGTIMLGTTPNSTAMEVSGTYTVSVPADAPVRVVGTATVPDGWEASDDGWQSPVPGAGWVITVGAGSMVVIRVP